METRLTFQYCHAPKACNLLDESKDSDLRFTPGDRLSDTLCKEGRLLPGESSPSLRRFRFEEGGQMLVHQLTGVCSFFPASERFFPPVITIVFQRVHPRF